MARSRQYSSIFDWGWILVGVLAVQLVSFVLWLAFPGHDPDTLTIVTDLQVLPIRVGSTLLAWRACRQHGLDARTRRAWLLLGLGFGAYCLGDIIWAWIEIVLDADPFPSLADAGYLSFYVLILAGLLSFPLALRTRGERLKFWLDALIVVGGGGTVLWYFIFLPVLNTTIEDPVASAFALAYPVGDLLLLLGVATVLLRRPDGGTTGALWVLAVSLAVMVVDDAGFGPMGVQDTYQSGDWPDIFWAASSFLMAVSAQYQWWRARDPSATRVVGETGVRLSSPLPYAAAALSQVMLVGVALFQGTHMVGGLVFGSVAVTVLVIARQLVAVRENARLIDEQADRRTALLDLSRRFSVEVSLDQIQPELLRAATTMLEAKHAGIARWDAARQRLGELSASDERHDAGTLSLMERASCQAAIDHEPVVFNGSGHVDPAGDQSDKPAGTVHRHAHGHTAVAVPILHDGRLFGTLAVTRTASVERFTRDDAEILGLLASMAVATMIGAERARLEGVLLAARTTEHELNNQLAVAAGYASLLIEDPDLAEHLRPLAQDILDGALEASRLVNEIRQIKRLDLLEGSVRDGNVIKLGRSVA